MPVQVSGIDHIVLRVQDPLKSVQWYADTLGLEPVRVEEFKAGELGATIWTCMHVLVVGVAHTRPCQAGAFPKSTTIGLLPLLL